MEGFNHRQSRWAQNVRGQFYVDRHCLYCDICRELAPTVFKLNYKREFSYVARQPETAEELAQVRKAVFYCPREAVHDDGLQFDWDAISSDDCQNAA